MAHCIGLMRYAILNCSQHFEVKMLFPLVDKKSWADKYGLPIKNSICQNCKKEFPLNTPFAIKGYRGLMTKEHACGKNFISSVAIPTGESLEIIRQTLFG